MTHDEDVLEINILKVIINRYHICQFCCSDKVGKNGGKYRNLVVL